MHNAEFPLPVEICNLPFSPAITKIIKKTLVLSVQAGVVGDRHGLRWEAGDAVHHAVLVDVHPEVIPASRLPGDHLCALEQTPWGRRWPRRLSCPIPATSEHPPASLE